MSNNLNVIGWLLVILISVLLVSCLLCINNNYKTKCYSIIYTIYGVVESEEHVHNLRILDGNAKYELNDIVFYIKPDMIAVDEHTHE